MLKPQEQFVNPTPLQLRSLVLDYLCHNGYLDTARAFTRDVSCESRRLDADGDEIMQSTSSNSELSDEIIRSVELRERVRTHILSGDVEAATDLLNEHFPSVLSISVASPLTTSPVKQTDYVASKSVDPLHLSLNLRILAFIEASRTIPLEYKPPGFYSDETTPHASPSHRTQTPSVIPETPESVTRQQTDLLSKAQKLYAAVKALPNAKDRETYHKELNNVSGLLAYPIPEKSMMSKYLSQGRREAVAEQINSAILYRTGHRVISDVELCTRHTTATWGFISDLHVKPPAPAHRPPGFSLPPTNTTRATPPIFKGTTGQEESVAEGAPLFDLRSFLESHT